MYVIKGSRFQRPMLPRCSGTVRQPEPPTWERSLLCNLKRDVGMSMFAQDRQNVLRAQCASIEMNAAVLDVVRNGIYCYLSGRVVRCETKGNGEEVVRLPETTVSYPNVIPSAITQECIIERILDT